MFVCFLIRQSTSASYLFVPLLVSDFDKYELFDYFIS